MQKNFLNSLQFCPLFLCKSLARAQNTEKFNGKFLTGTPTDYPIRDTHHFSQSLERENFLLNIFIRQEGTVKLTNLARLRKKQLHVAFPLQQGEHNSNAHQVHRKIITFFYFLLGKIAWDGNCIGPKYDKC